MEKLDPHDPTPFRDPLVPSTISEIHRSRGKLFEFKHDPTKIIRMKSFKDLEERLGIIDPTAVVVEGRRLYEELENRYGIPVPTTFVIGEDSSGGEAVYGITDRIEGANLEEVTATPEITERVVELYASIAHYYLDKITTGGAYLADINNPSQYVYGRKAGNESSEIFLVDTDLYFRNGETAIYPIVLWLVRHMLYVEAKFGKKFERARQIIGEILSRPLVDMLTPDQQTRIREIIDRTKGYLGGQTPIQENYEPHPIFSDI